MLKEGLSEFSPKNTLLLLQALEAMVRLLKIRTAHNHLSTRTFDKLEAIGLFFKQQQPANGASGLSITSPQGLSYAYELITAEAREQA